MARWAMVTYGGGHVAALIPVAREALRRGHEVTILGLTTAREALERAGLPSIGFADLWAHAAPDARRFGAELVDALPLGGSVSRHESEAYLGISFGDLAAERGEAEARRAYGLQGRQAFLPVSFMRRVLATMAPDVVVATNSPRSEQAAVLASGTLGLPSVCVVDLFALQEVRWIGRPAYANRVCVLNKSVREMMLAHGRRDDEVVVTGNPAFDALTEVGAVKAGNALRARRGWNDDRVTLLWASQIEPAHHPFSGEAGDPSLPRRVEATLRTLVRESPRFRLVVRYHPSERETFVAEPGVVFSPTDEPLVALLHAVDIVVVTASTVGLEASLAGRAVLAVGGSVFTADAPYAEMGVATGVAAVELLPSAVRTLADEGASSTRPGSTPVGHATATRRVLAVIESLLPHGD